MVTRVFNIAMSFITLQGIIAGVQVGDVVLVHDESPRINWRLTIIKDLIIAGDNLGSTIKHDHNLSLIAYYTR